MVRFVSSTGQWIGDGASDIPRDDTGNAPEAMENPPAAAEPEVDASRHVVEQQLEPENEMIGELTPAEEDEEEAAAEPRLERPQRIQLRDARGNEIVGDEA